MSKADSIMNARGGEIRGSAGQRPAPAAMPSMGVKIAPVDRRLIGLARSKSVYEIPTERISVDPDQPRNTIDEDDLAKLAHSIRVNGLLHPIGVRFVEEIEGYRVIYGERRFKAALRNESPTIAATVWDRPLTEAEILTVQCAENLSRKDIRPIKQARSFRTLLEIHQITQAELAASVGVSEGMVAQSLRLLDLPEDVQGLVAAGEIAASTGYAIAAKVADPQEQRDIAERIAEGRMSRKDAAETIRKASSVQGGVARSKGKGRGTKAKLVTSRAFKADGGYKVTVERAKGIEPEALIASLLEVVTKVRAEQGGDQAAA